MELCELVINISSPATLAQETDHRIPLNRTFHSSSTSPISIAVYRLHTNIVLDVHKLSWNSKPDKSGLLGVFDIAEQFVARSPTFHCAQDSLQTFEFMCHDSDDGGCAVEWWQDMRSSLGKKPFPMISKVFI